MQTCNNVGTKLAQQERSKTEPSRAKGFISAIWVAGFMW